VERTDVLEEPISPELVLVDGELAARAREASADSPWLLPAVAEARQRAEAARAVAVEERPAAEAPAEPSFSGHVRATAVIGSALVALLAAVALAPELVPGSAKPTLARRSAEPAALTPPTPSTPKPAAKRPQAKRVVKPKAAPKTKPKPTTTKPKPSARPAPAPKPAAKPKPRAAVKVTRVFSWRRYRGAVYYQVHVLRGAKTVYEARTLQRTASIRLKLRPGRYHAVVRPAVPSDVGIILGPTIMDKIVRI
jgi:hypothetical protein